MVSWLEELDRREAAAREGIAELWDQIAELTRCLAERRTCCPGCRSHGRR